MTDSLDKKIAGSIVIGHDGSVWFFSASSTKNADKLEKAYNTLKDALGDLAEIAALKSLIKRARKEGFVWQKLR